MPWRQDGPRHRTTRSRRLASPGCCFLARGSRLLWLAVGPTFGTQAPVLRCLDGRARAPGVRVPCARAGSCRRARRAFLGRSSPRAIRLCGGLSRKSTRVICDNPHRALPAVRPTNAGAAPMPLSEAMCVAMWPLGAHPERCPPPPVHARRSSHLAPRLGFLTAPGLLLPALPTPGCLGGRLLGLWRCCGATLVPRPGYGALGARCPGRTACAPQAPLAGPTTPHPRGTAPYPDRHRQTRARAPALQSGLRLQKHFRYCESAMCFFLLALSQRSHTTAMDAARRARVPARVIRA